MLPISEQAIAKIRSMSREQYPSIILPAPMITENFNGTPLEIGPAGIPSRSVCFDCGPYNGAMYEWDNSLTSCAMCNGYLIFWSKDGQALHDWRDMQQLKNLILGPEYLAVEVFPPESELRDPSNAFYLWFWKPGRRHIGFPPKGRSIKSPDDCLAPQRPWPPGFGPTGPLREEKR